MQGLLYLKGEAPAAQGALGHCPSSISRGLQSLKPSKNPQVNVKNQAFVL